ncbi:MAG: NAD(P)H-hydrate dehydratase [Bacteroidales bacterium]|nr:NAD(P)H-hydrate dehydratase [Bacteroidales bacterium]
MIKILPAGKIREADTFTITNEPIASVDLMERAAGLCYDWIVKKKPFGKSIKLFCGTGNNGGDGLVIARLLTKAGYNCEVFLVKFSEKCSDDFLINLQRLQESGPSPIQDVLSGDELPVIEPDELVIDAMFGTGLSKPVNTFPENLIGHINKSGAVVIAIDISSGMFANQLPDSRNGAIIQADYTLTFQFPKLSFFFAESEQYTGIWEVLPIGLHPDFIQSTDTDHFLVEAGDIAALLKPRKRFSHKGNFGHALLVAGSYGKMGAAILAAKACMRTGAGLLTAHIPAKGYNILQTAFPEAMVSIDEEQEYFSGVKDLQPYNAIAIGPGIGTAEQTKTGLKLLIQDCRAPLILDADALNILGENKTWLSFLPPGSILTPHPKEFERIASKSNNSLDRLELQQQFSAKYNVFVILKGAFTSITTPDGTCYFNPTGNPGMASGGSGDVLTGILLGLLAQGYSPLTTCMAGAFLHGFAGDLAAAKRGYEALIASDIIDNLGKAFLKL